MAMSTGVIGFQDSGYVRGFSNKSLKEVNNALNKAKIATPTIYHDIFRERIYKDQWGYCWEWVIK